MVDVYIVDDDRDIRLTLDHVLKTAGYRVQQFASAVQFLANCESVDGSCVLADIRLPGMDGLELQEEIVRRGLSVSTIVITGHADVPLAVRAMKAGAFHLLEKPFSNETLLQLLPEAISAAKEKLRASETTKRARDLVATLSPREKQVAELVEEGLSNKEIGGRLRVSHRTVELHRARVMEKLGVSAVADMIKILLDASGRLLRTSGS